MVCPDLIGIGETISPTGVLTSTAIKKRVRVQPKFQESCQSLEGNGKIDIGIHERLAEEIILTLEKCYATPTENPQDKVSHIILEDGYDYFSERSLLLFF